MTNFSMYSGEDVQATIVSLLLAMFSTQRVQHMVCDIRPCFLNVIIQNLIVINTADENSQLTFEDSWVFDHSYVRSMGGWFSPVSSILKYSSSSLVTASLALNKPH